MSPPALNLVIDARPRGPRGLLAAEIVLGRSVLSRLVDQAVQAAGPGGSVAIHGGDDDRDALASLLTESEFESESRTEPGRIALRSGPPSADDDVLRTDRLYDGRRLRRALVRGRRLETAEVWRLDRPEALAGAEQELNRRLTYQPLGRYWAFPIAERLAAALAPTRVRPNAVTLAAAGLMLGGAAIVACGGFGWIGRTASALAFAAALVLDTADGRLARLQATCSAFGQWLDQVLDELADLALHAAIAWAMFQAEARPYWLALGLLYTSGKYMFLVQSLTGAEMEKAEAAPETRGGSKSRIRGLVAAIGHADLRWHLWIVLAFVGRLDLALIAYALYFPMRAGLGIARKGAAHA
jgi:phosphatidylglycerophosphate synthase